MSHKPFRLLRAKMADTPERRARVAVESAGMLAAAALGHILDSSEVISTGVLGLVAVDEDDGMITATLDDLYLAALREGVEALGGRLQVTAVFPDRTIELVGHEPVVQSEHAD